MPSCLRTLDSSGECKKLEIISSVVEIIEVLIISSIGKVSVTTKSVYYMYQNLIETSLGQNSPLWNKTDTKRYTEKD
jgi:hypothetical protein